MIQRSLNSVYGVSLRELHNELVTGHTWQKCGRLQKTMEQEGSRSLPQQHHRTYYSNASNHKSFVCDEKRGEAE